MARAYELTASRTITMTISDWARLEEIRLFRGIKTLPDVLKYIIRTESCMIRDKQERDNKYVAELAEIKTVSV